MKTEQFGDGDVVMTTVDASPPDVRSRDKCEYDGMSALLQAGEIVGRRSRRWTNWPDLFTVIAFREEMWRIWFNSMDTREPFIGSFARRHKLGSAFVTRICGFHHIYGTNHLGARRFAILGLIDWSFFFKHFARHWSWIVWKRTDICFGELYCTFVFIDRCEFSRFSVVVVWKVKLFKTDKRRLREKSSIGKMGGRRNCHLGFLYNRWGI